MAADTIPALCGSLQQQARKLVDLYEASLPADVYKYLQAASHDAAVVPYFYLLPKVHKLPAVTREHLPLLKGRPIAACHSWVTNALSVYLADVLNGVCYAQYPQVLPDSKALVRLLEHTSVGKDAWLVTFDVESMYPSINNADAVDACAQAAARGGHRGDLVTDLLSFFFGVTSCHLSWTMGTVSLVVHFTSRSKVPSWVPLLPHLTAIYILPSASSQPSKLTASVMGVTGLRSISASLMMAFSSGSGMRLVCLLFCSSLTLGWAISASVYMPTSRHVCS